MLDFIGLIIANPSSLQNHHAGETFMLASLLFPSAPQCSPQLFILESPLLNC